jgi:hypothetical protein
MNVQIGGTYTHYKGKNYMVLAVAKETESLEDVVVYKALYADAAFGEGAVWVRPLAMFTEEVIVDGIAVPRFKLNTNTL